jgi:hypothetical protein
MNRRVASSSIWGRSVDVEISLTSLPQVLGWFSEGEPLVLHVAVINIENQERAALALYHVIMLRWTPPGSLPSGSDPEVATPETHATTGACPYSTLAGIFATDINGCATWSSS